MGAMRRDIGGGWRNEQNGGRRRSEVEGKKGEGSGREEKGVEGGWMDFRSHVSQGKPHPWPSGQNPAPMVMYDEWAVLESDHAADLQITPCKAPRPVRTSTPPQKPSHVRKIRLTLKTSDTPEKPKGGTHTKIFKKLVPIKRTIIAREKRSIKDIYEREKQSLILVLPVLPGILSEAQSQKPSVQAWKGKTWLQLGENGKLGCVVCKHGMSGKPRTTLRLLL